MSCEIELKLRLSPSDARCLAAHSMLAGVKAEKAKLFNTYYDTPDLELRRRGVALRLRRKGTNVWLMTVKGGDSGAGGLAQRNEWEKPVQPGVFDFAIVEDPELRAFLEARSENLAPVFTTDFSRTAWRLRRDDSVVEMALDRGKISASALTGNRPVMTESLCELELELLEGKSPDVLFDVAIELACEFDLHPEIVSKAERGYALAAAGNPVPVKGNVAVIKEGMAPVDAFRSVASACLLHLQRNENGAIEGKDPEFVHQARVAIRRLRSALRVFSPVLSESFIATYAPRWKALSSQLGEARDWDVFIAETLASLDKAFPENDDLANLRRRAVKRRLLANSGAARALRQREYSRLLLAFSAALYRQAPPLIGKMEPSKGKHGLRRFAVKRLRRRWQTLQSVVLNCDWTRSEYRHELRIEFKKLRYALEFFLPLLPGKRAATCLSSIAKIQELLGGLNDHVTAVQFVRLLSPGRSGESLVRGWVEGRNQLLVESLNEQLKWFSACKKPW